MSKGRDIVLEPHEHVAIALNCLRCNSRNLKFRFGYVDSEDVEKPRGAILETQCGECGFHQVDTIASLMLTLQEDGQHYLKKQRRRLRDEEDAKTTD